MRVLVACEYSGVVRDAFLKRGHDVVSCDLLPSESPLGDHYQGDVMDIIDDGWDMMIAHPPCTYLTSAGNAWLGVPGRSAARDDAFDFVISLAAADIPKICIENPVGFLNSHWRKPDQIIHPYFFGDPRLKRTCLWLKGLFPLSYVPGFYPVPEPVYVSTGATTKGKKIHWTESIGKKKGTGWMERSRTSKAIAAAMARQWG